MDMELVLAFAVGGALLWMMHTRYKKLAAEGKVVRRSSRFQEEAEDFICSMERAEQVAERIRQLPYAEMKISLDVRGGQSFQFAGIRWRAELCFREIKDGKHVYTFQFLNWNMHNGMLMHEAQMNMLLTAVEKMFLDIDPDTQVQTRLVETKTRHHL